MGPSCPTTKKKGFYSGKTARCGILFLVLMVTVLPDSPNSPTRRKIAIVHREEQNARITLDL
jgi:hypothetical protein